jgi:hypothetical protein
LRAEAVRTQREKAEQDTEVSAAEESFPVRDTGAPESAAADDPPTPADDEDGWVVRFEQQFNIFLTVSYKHRWPIDLSSDITFCLSEL